jgi:hypothetical protein
VVRWSEDKDRWLRKSRGVSFQEIADTIISGNYLDVLENQVRFEQDIFIIRIRGYTWAVPFVIEQNSTIFLKTAYPSRKFHKIYGGPHERKD